MMKKRNKIPTGLIAICAAGGFFSTSCAQSAQMGITDGRARALAAAGAGLLGVVVGGIALARSAGLIGRGRGRAGGFAGLVLGLLGTVLSIVHLGGLTGGFGTGGGKAGAIVGLGLGLIGAGLGALVLARSRRGE